MVLDIMPKVTVLMGVYNNSRYLEEAVSSILNQTFKDFEFLIVDDASTDETPEILSRYAELDARVRVISLSENRGLGHCLALGVKESLGEFVARMDADDIAASDRLSKQYQFLRKNEHVDVLGTWARIIDEAGAEREVRKVPLDEHQIKSKVWSNPFIHSSVMFRRNSIIAAGSYNPELRKRQDYDLWFRAVEYGLGLQNIGEPLINYRFSQATYRRNNARVMFSQAWIGIKGCYRVRSSIQCYVYVVYPFIRSLFPIFLQDSITAIFNRFDPRKK